MGTRADFYIGRGKDAEWLGSIAFDGYPDGIADDVLAATDEQTYREEVMRFFGDDRTDVSGPEHGWPWPWPNSQTTDYSYALDDGCVWVSCFGEGWDKVPDYDPDDEAKRSKVEFPDMTDKKNVTLGSRSGLIVFGTEQK